MGKFVLTPIFDVPEESDAGDDVTAVLVDVVVAGELSFSSSSTVTLLGEYLSPLPAASPNFFGVTLEGLGRRGGGVDMNGGGTLKFGGGTDKSGGGPGGRIMWGGGRVGVERRPGPLGCGGARLMFGIFPGTTPGKGISSGRGMSMVRELLLTVRPR